MSETPPPLKTKRHQQLDWQLRQELDTDLVGFAVDRFEQGDSWELFAISLSNAIGTYVSSTTLRRYLMDFPEVIAARELAASSS